jgi:hypothetical protein
MALMIGGHIVCTRLFLARIVYLNFLIEARFFFAPKRGPEGPRAADILVKQWVQIISRPLTNKKLQERPTNMLGGP